MQGRLPRLLLLMLLLRRQLGGVEAQCWLEDCTPNPNAGYGCGAPPSRCRPEPKQCTEPASRATQPLSAPGAHESVATDPLEEPIGPAPIEEEAELVGAESIVHEAELIGGEPALPYDIAASERIVCLSLLGAVSSLACLYWRHREELRRQQAHDAQLARDQAEEQRRQDRHAMERAAHEAEQRRRDELLALERCRVGCEPADDEPEPFVAAGPGRELGRPILPHRLQIKRARAYTPTRGGRIVNRVEANKCSKPFEGPFWLRGT